MLNSIFIASTNVGKIAEFKFVLGNLSENISLTYLQKNTINEPDEPYNSFVENAIHKAKYYASYSNLPTLCDDSGLCIEALNGFPGVKTKDFAQECGSMQKAFEYLEKTLQNKPKTTIFRASVAIYFPKEDKTFTSEEITTGALEFPPRGDYGFGFHPIFVPAGFNKTMSELGLRIIDEHISPRVRAVHNLIKILKNENLI